jgi:hypothetical protein
MQRVTSYGTAPADPTLARPMLHAAVLGFVHPATGEYTEYCAPLPADMASAVARRRDGGLHQTSPGRGDLRLTGNETSERATPRRHRRHSARQGE